jgi:hypothetical protein
MVSAFNKGREEKERTPQRGELKAFVMQDRMEFQ